MKTSDSAASLTCLNKTTFLASSQQLFQNPSQKCSIQALINLVCFRSVVAIIISEPDTNHSAETGTEILGERQTEVATGDNITSATGSTS
jgi:hypothetical protein